jgi:squalene-hopene/tetraprenyl-beta-curcumene cyclase
MMLLLVSSGLRYVTGEFLQAQPEDVVSLIKGMIFTLGSFVLGLPWVIFVKNKFNRDIESWINSFGWVYGIITGFLLAFYQFIL